MNVYPNLVGGLDFILEICNVFITEEAYSETAVRGEGFPDSAPIKEAVETQKLVGPNLDIFPLATIPKP